MYRDKIKKYIYIMLISFKLLFTIIAILNFQSCYSQQHASIDFYMKNTKKKNIMSILILILELINFVCFEKKMKLLEALLHKNYFYSLFIFFLYIIGVFYYCKININYK